ncbi:hypothetical protein Patl1_27137 [Pistacia atlantica]|uniref:Uncharacterized protein n=1 Tax=Pistacia atlantica TaxID=434234 RepID=A0ACC1B316_9ROSI|nr:hypothetical protein Patl1_27137 [Pistacia atlantica]
MTSETEISDSGGRVKTSESGGMSFIERQQTLNRDGFVLNDPRIYLVGQWKFAFLSLGRPERDVYGTWEQYLGLKHSDNAPKRAYFVNQLIDEDATYNVASTSTQLIDEDSTFNVAGFN